MILGRKILFTSSLLLLIFKGVFSQEPVSLEDEYRFIQHLNARGNAKEALYLLDQFPVEGASFQDSINYLKGWILYGMKDLEASSFYLTKVKPNSRFFEKSNFFSAYNYAYLGKTQKSIDLLTEFTLNDSPEVKAMSNFQLAGISLLDRQLETFTTLVESFNGRYSYLAAEEQHLLNYHERILQFKNRSAFVAGMLSFAVPGLGKIYAGKTSEGISSFLYVGALSAVSYDLYNRLGQHPLFFISAAITSVFYIGNIWGSAAAVNRHNREFNYEINQRILLDMHIPLRKLYP
jgi:TM2 domain-containing membrane protein YozV